VIKREPVTNTCGLEPSDSGKVDTGGPLDLSARSATTSEPFSLRTTMHKATFSGVASRPSRPVYTCDTTLEDIIRCCTLRTAYQCCGSGSGIRCLFDPWIRDPEWVFSGSRIPRPYFEELQGSIFWSKTDIYSPPPPA
jgi:hypothetical protein